MLHQSVLGIFKIIVDILRSIAIEDSSATLPGLVRRRLRIKVTSRYSEFRVFDTNKGGYFC